MSNYRGNGPRIRMQLSGNDKANVVLEFVHKQYFWMGAENVDGLAIAVSAQHTGVRRFLKQCLASLEKKRKRNPLPK